MKAEKREGGDRNDNFNYSLIDDVSFFIYLGGEMNDGKKDEGKKQRWKDRRFKTELFNKSI